MDHPSIAGQNGRPSPRMAPGRAAPALLLAAIVLALGGIAIGDPRAASAQSADLHDPDAAYRIKSSLDPAITARGEKVYGEVCAACHDSGANRAPPRMIIRQLTPDAVYRALTTGIMKPMASGLSDAERMDVAQAVTEHKLGSIAAAAPAMCHGDAARFDRSEPPPFTGWGIDLASTHNIPDAVAGVDRGNVARLKLKWAVGFPGALRARSQPAIAGGALFVGSHDGTVYALDRATGCARWIFDASGEVRTAIVVSPWAAGDAKAAPIAYFGDILGNLYAVDAFSGRLKWRVHMDPHPSTTLTAAPILYKSMLYVAVSSLEEGTAGTPSYGCCTFRGSIAAVDATNGQEKWRTYLVPPPKPRGNNGAGGDRFGPSGVAVWGAPAVDPERGQLYITTGDNYSTPATGLSDAIVAMDLATGRIRWSYQAMPADAWNGGCGRAAKVNCPDEDGPDFDFGAGPVLAKAPGGRALVLAGQKSGFAYAVDRDTGKLVWKRQVGRGGVQGGVHFGLSVTGDRLIVPITDSPDGKTYAMAPRPGLYALNLAGGDYAWQTPAPNQCEGRAQCMAGYSGAISSTSQLVFAGSTDGAIRILDAATGAMRWETSTLRDYKTVNGSIAHGGSMGGGAAPMVYHGMMFMPSGYGFAGKMPGNVLLAFSVE